MKSKPKELEHGVGCASGPPSFLGDITYPPNGRTFKCSPCTKERLGLALGSAIVSCSEKEARHLTDSQTADTHGTDSVCKNKTTRS